MGRLLLYGAVGPALSAGRAAGVMAAQNGSRVAHTCLTVDVLYSPLTVYSTQRGCQACPGAGRQLGTSS